MELKLYFKMLVTCYLIRLHRKSFTKCKGTDSILCFTVYLLFQRCWGACAEWWRRLSVSSVFKPTVQLVWGHMTAF